MTRLGAEEPVPRVLRVGLPDVEELDGRGVALEVVLEEPQVVLEVLLVEGEAHLLVDLLEGGAALGQDRDGVDGGRDGVHLEGREGVGVDLLRHAVVHLSMSDTGGVISSGGARQR